MTIPSGSGTEVLKRKTLHANNATTTTILTGEANHIYTIISVIFCNMTNGAGNIGMQVNDGSNPIYLLDNTSVGGYNTFVWNDKFVLEEDDILKVYNQVTNGDWYVSYIEQDWT
tara:strand:- start:578 stop:919 length:342 start_codon:yes stop_codon:yes gene_type:complete